MDYQMLGFTAQSCDLKSAFLLDQLLEIIKHQHIFTIISASTLPFHSVVYGNLVSENLSSCFVSLQLFDQITGGFVE